MAERLKNIFFTRKSVSLFVTEISRHYQEFDATEFRKLVFCDEWEGMELKARMRHMTLCLHRTLPRNYGKALKILLAIAPEIKGFEAMVLPDFVEMYGMEAWGKSLDALGYFTRFSSSEFAIRPFIKKDPDRVMKRMFEWAQDKHENVRRFASEGCRPRLPWAMALPDFQKNPDLIIPVLERLRNDKSEFVRRSVANNLNDISKDHPDMVLDLCECWYGESRETDWIIRHACRTLLKSGNVRAMMLFGYGDPVNIEVSNLKLEKGTLKIGDELRFSFDIRIRGDKACKVRMDYAIDYVKASGKTSRKVFKLTESSYDPGKHEFRRKQSLADMSTRKHYPGGHNLTVVVNGIEKGNVGFRLRKSDPAG